MPVEMTDSNTFKCKNHLPKNMHINSKQHFKSKFKQINCFTLTTHVQQHFNVSLQQPHLNQNYILAKTKQSDTCFTKYKRKPLKGHQFALHLQKWKRKKNLNLKLKAKNRAQYWRKCLLKADLKWAYNAKKGTSPTHQDPYRNRIARIEWKIS